MYRLCRDGRGPTDGFFRRFWLLIFVSLAAASAMLPADAQQEASKLKVVATFSILGDFARYVGGDRVDVTMLVAPALRLTESQMTRLAG